MVFAIGFLVLRTKPLTSAELKQAVALTKPLTSGKDYVMVFAIGFLVLLTKPLTSAELNR
jgi:hypothetical protein